MNHVMGLFYAFEMEITYFLLDYNASIITFYGQYSS